MRIGIDFDNTLAGYDRVFATAAIEAGLLPEGFSGTKRAVRDHVRALEDGETLWRRLQGAAYGRLMGAARLMPGAGAFLIAAKRLGIRVVIISHKTRTSPYDPDQIDLRAAAHDWMADQGFFDPGRFGLDPYDVFFEDDRDAKVARIAFETLSAFVDDLEEVLTHPAFPETTRRLLYHPGESQPAPGPYTVCRSWKEVSDVLVG